MMTSPVTRSLLGWEHENPDVYNQVAIPWCTTHDHQSNESLHACLAGIIKEGECHISTGPPDHKWWRDTE